VKNIKKSGMRGCWLARYAGSPADFRRKIEFFVFAPLLWGWPKTGFLFSIFDRIKSKQRY
jgi:hypothetical protein